MATEPIQIMSKDSNNVMKVNLHDLRLIFLAENVKDKYVSIISISGVFRQGKSFLLNFFLRYLSTLEAKDREIEDWLVCNDEKLSGFPFASGTKKHTSGIWMWPTPFFARKSTGEEVAIFLLDTEGSFDNDATLNDCAKIFTFSTLISSMQIYNVSRGLKQYDLHHLQLFGGYGQLLNKEAEYSAPFQNFCLLIRDWPNNDEFPYGQSRGVDYLNSFFGTEHPVLKQEVDMVKKLFEKIDCCLLPYPGRIVDGQKRFQGDLKDIDEIFLEHVRDFVVGILQSDNLVIKAINGEKLKTQHLYNYIEEYGKIMESENFPDIETINQATIEAILKTAVSKAFELYKKNMNADVHGSVGLEEERLYEIHHENKKISLHFYCDFRKENKDTFETYLLKLKNEMDDLFKNKYYVENKRKLLKEQEQREAEERARRSQAAANTLQQRSSNTAMSERPSAETIATTAAVVGGIAAIGFGLLKAFSGSSRND